ncbi:TPA: hypothetical protein P0E30_005102 [Vibrio harveyi]|nr:hypothetical protein [Vibrio harveyi]
MEPIHKVNALIQKGQEALASHRKPPRNVIGFPTCDFQLFTTWKTQSLSFLEKLYSSSNPYYTEFSDKVQQAYTGSIQTGLGVLQAVRDEIESGDIETAPDVVNPIRVIENICDRFHLVVKQLRNRYNDRDTLDIQDEYDVQDLFHSLLHLEFDDIRPEESVPSNAGKSTRVDFLLKPERIVIEIKKTRKGLGAKEVGSELIEDIHRYSSHPDCDALICFVYDPEGRVSNPRGLESDLNKDENDLSVRTFIRP